MTALGRGRTKSSCLLQVYYQNLFSVEVKRAAICVGFPWKATHKLVVVLALFPAPSNVYKIVNTFHSYTEPGVTLTL